MDIIVNTAEISEMSLAALPMMPYSICAYTMNILKLHHDEKNLSGHTNIECKSHTHAITESKALLGRLSLS